MGCTSTVVYRPVAIRVPALYTVIHWSAQLTELSSLVYTPFFLDVAHNALSPLQISFDFAQPFSRNLRFHPMASTATNVLLTTANYLLWEPAMQDYLHAKGHWFWIHNPVPATDPKNWLKYMSRDEAVGEIRCHITAELQSIATDSEDLQMILNSIKEEYGKSSFATHHNALQGLLLVHQESSESIPVFISHTQEALCLQSTRPPPTPLAAPSGSTCTYLLQDADKELLIAVLLCGTKYTALTTSLLTQPEPSIQQVEDALKNEEAHCLGVGAVSNLAAPAVRSTCAFCGHSGHTVELCFKFQDARLPRSRCSSRSRLAPKSSGRRRVRPMQLRSPLLHLHPLNQQERQVFVHPHLPAP